MLRPDLNITYLLAARGLVFSTESGFTLGPLAVDMRQRNRGGREAADRSYWTAYDYFEHEREVRAERRAKFFGNLRARIARVINRLARPAEGMANTEHVAA